MFWHEELRLYTAGSCDNELFGGLEDDNILSMHLESHIGLSSASLYDFNGKALWEDAPQEIKMKCVGWWLEVNGCFLSSSLAFFFGLLCRAGFPIITQTLRQARVKLKKAFRIFRWKDIPIKKRKHSCSSKVQVDGENLKKLETEENPYT